MTPRKPNFIEYLFEAFLWKSRAIILLPVLFAVMSSFALFIAGSFQIGKTIFYFIPPGANEPDYESLLINIIGAVDLYLIGVVLLIFGFGIYELFISKIDIAREDKEVNILEITSLDDLKNRLMKVIIMVLIVHFFKLILTVHTTKPLELLFLAGGILLIATSSFFIKKIEKEE